MPASSTGFLDDAPLISRTHLAQRQPPAAITLLRRDCLPGPTALARSRHAVFITGLMGHENAERVHTVYSAGISAIDDGQTEFLNLRLGGYSNPPPAPSGKSVLANLLSVR